MEKHVVEEFIGKYYNKDWLSTYLGVMWDKLKTVDLFEVTKEVYILKKGNEYSVHFYKGV